LGSELAIAQAKCELLAEMDHSGLAILNYDNPLLLKTAETVWQGQTLTFGLTGGDIRGEWRDGGTLRVRGLDLPLPLPGQHNALNYLAAIGVAEALKLDWSGLTQGLTVNLPGGRARRYELPGDVVILDETYNAGLESMLAAVQLLAQTSGQRRIAVLGTMKELGERSLEFHARVGAAVREHQLDALLILADAAESKAFSQGAAPMVTESFSNQEA
jgi:UDP-N-acetylmuramoyl-tripeptide--D-alanyl-D-alanine ligase